MELAIKGGEPSLDFTAPETALASLGACILSNLNKGASTLGLQVDDARVEFDVTKRYEPLGFETVEYHLIVKSPEHEEKLNALFERATTDGTATNALLEGFKIKKYLEILKSQKYLSDEFEACAIGMIGRYIFSKKGCLLNLKSGVN